MKRNKVDIVFDMLNAMQQKGGRILPTHLLFKSNLSHQRMKLYIAELVEKKLILPVSDKGKLFYELTDEGRAFLVQFKQVRAFTEAFGL